MQVTVMYAVGSHPQVHVVGVRGFKETPESRTGLPGHWELNSRELQGEVHYLVLDAAYVASVATVMPIGDVHHIIV